MPFVNSLSTYHGVTAANYTRPSLASLHSPTFASALQTRPVSPTLAKVLSDAGYTCLGFSPNPNTHKQFGFAEGFDHYDAYVSPGTRGSPLRQDLAEFDTLIYFY